MLQVRHCWYGSSQTGTVSYQYPSDCWAQQIRRWVTINVRVPIIKAISAHVNYQLPDHGMGFRCVSGGGGVRWYGTLQFGSDHSS